MLSSVLSSRILSGSFITPVQTLKMPVFFFFFFFCSTESASNQLFCAGPGEDREPGGKSHSSDRNFFRAFFILLPDSSYGSRWCLGRKGHRFTFKHALCQCDVRLDSGGGERLRLSDRLTFEQKILCERKRKNSQAADGNREGKGRKKRCRDVTVKLTAG